MNLVPPYPPKPQNYGYGAGPHTVSVTLPNTLPFPEDMDSAWEEYQRRQSAVPFVSGGGGIWLSSLPVFEVRHYTRIEMLFTDNDPMFDEDRGRLIRPMKLDYVFEKSGPLKMTGLTYRHNDGFRIQAVPAVSGRSDETWTFTPHNPAGPGGDWDLEVVVDLSAPF